MQAGVDGEKISAGKKNKNAEKDKTNDKPEDIDHHGADFPARSFKGNRCYSPEKSSKQGGKFSYMVHILLWLTTREPDFGVLDQLALPNLEMQFCFLFFGIGVDFADSLPGCNILSFPYAHHLEV